MPSLQPRAILFLAVSCFALANPSHAADVAMPGWTQDAINASVAQCRNAIIDNATRDYLARHNLKREQLPADFRSTIAPAIEPFLRTCDCMIRTVSREMPFSNFNLDSIAVQARIKQLSSPGGSCAPKAGT